MSIGQLEGYVAGILVCPETIPPSEWLPAVWDGDGASALRSGWVAGVAARATLDHYDGVSRIVDGAPEHFVTIYDSDKTAVRCCGAPGSTASSVQFGCGPMRGSGFRVMGNSSGRPVLVSSTLKTSLAMSTGSHRRHLAWLIAESPSPRTSPATSVRAIRAHRHKPGGSPRVPRCGRPQECQDTRTGQWRCAAAGPEESEADRGHDFPAAHDR